MDVRNAAKVPHVGHSLTVAIKVFQHLRSYRNLIEMLLNPADEADYPAIVDLANLAYRGAGASASWTIETGIIEGQRLNESLLREDLAAKPDVQLLIYRDRPGWTATGIRLARTNWDVLFWSPQRNS